MSYERNKVVFGYPARKNAEINPYNSLFSDSLEIHGWRVVDPSPAEALCGRAAVVHLHWPQALVSYSWPTTIRRTTLMVATLLIQKIRGAKIVWTAHNLRSHGGKRPRLEHVLMALITRLLDGVVFLNDHSQSEAYRIFPKLAKLPVRVVPHGAYGATYPSCSEQDIARTRWNIATTATVVGFVGEIKPYKGIQYLLDAVLQMRPGLLTILIAGRFPNNQWGYDLKNKIIQAQSLGHDLVTHDGRLDNQELASAIAVCDLIALPYVTGENSGLAILIAERDRALLLPSDYKYDELASQLDPALVYRFDKLTGDILLAASCSARAAVRDGRNNHRFRIFHDWTKISREINEFYLHLRIKK